LIADASAVGHPDEPVTVETIATDRRHGGRGSTPDYRLVAEGGRRTIYVDAKKLDGHHLVDEQPGDMRQQSGYSDIEKGIDQVTRHRFPRGAASNHGVLIVKLYGLRANQHDAAAARIRSYVDDIVQRRALPNDIAVEIRFEDGSHVVETRRYDPRAGWMPTVDGVRRIGLAEWAGWP